MADGTGVPFGRRARSTAFAALAAASVLLAAAGCAPPHGDATATVAAHATPPATARPGDATPSADPPSATPTPVKPTPVTTTPPAPDSLTGWPTTDELAAAAAATLTVKGRAPKTGYDRDLFGSGWVDIERNGCGTRNDMLAMYLDDVAKDGDCKVTGGVLQDAYTGDLIDFFPGSGTPVQIDHVVALSDAWQKGAQGWPWATRVAFANDPLNLIPTDASTNQAKGDGDAATWLPPNKAFRCEYVARQVAVKAKYQVWVTEAEHDAMLRVLDSCPGQPLPAPGEQSTTASNTGGAEPTTDEEPAPAKTPSGGATDPQFRSCRVAKESGYGPYVQGTDPEYAWYRDGDSDGIVCE